MREPSSQDHAQHPPTKLNEVLPLLQAVVGEAAAPEGALHRLHRAYWESIHLRIESFEGAWQIVADLMDDLEYYEPRPEWRAQSSCFFGSEEAVQEVQTALAALANVTGE